MRHRFFRRLARWRGCKYRLRGLASAGVRFGEAAHPGPLTVDFLTANLGSWRTMRTWTESRSEDVLLLQETRVTERSIAPSQASATRAGWNSVWLPAEPNQHGPASGGLAILCRAPRRVQQISHTGSHANRWCHAVVELSRRRPLHVVSVYGYDTSQPQAARRNAELFAEIFAVLAELGDARWLVGGDWNTEPQEIWELVADEGITFSVHQLKGQVQGSPARAAVAISIFSSPVVGC